MQAQNTQAKLFNKTFFKVQTTYLKSSKLCLPKSFILKEKKKCICKEVVIFYLLKWY